MNAKHVTKEELKNYHFVHHDVLTTREEKSERDFHLNEATRLGNDYKAKVQLVLETTDGAIVVETTVWAHTDNHVELKAGVDIPVQAIREVIFY